MEAAASLRGYGKQIDVLTIAKKSHSPIHTDLRVSLVLNKHTWDCPVDGVEWSGLKEKS